MRAWMVLAAAVAVAACSDSSDGGGSGNTGGSGGSGGSGGGSSGATCDSAVKALCTKACGCGGGSCRVQVDSSTVISSTSQAECESNLSQACSPSVDYAKCGQDIDAAACQDSAIGKIIAAPASCKAP